MESDNEGAHSNSRGPLDPESGSDGDELRNPSEYSDSEAEESRGGLESDAPEEDDDDDNGEDLMDDNMFQDYRPMDELDRYEQAGLDDSEDDRSLGQIFRDREAADRDMDRRQASQGRRGRGLPDIIADDDSDDPGYLARHKRARMGDVDTSSNDGTIDPESGNESEGDMGVNLLAEMAGLLREYVTQANVRACILRKLKSFFINFRAPDSREYRYQKRIQDLVAANRESLEVEYSDLSGWDPGNSPDGSPYSRIAMWIADAPTEMFAILSEAAWDIILQLHPEYHRIKETIHVRIAGLPIMDSIRDIRQLHLNCLIKTGGVVTRRTGVFPQLQQVKFDCVKCGFVLGPFFQNTTHEVKPGSCPECQSKGPFAINVEQTIYRNYQKITLQESPGSVPAGRLPRYKDVILLHDLIDQARPGEEIEVTGIYTNNFDAALNTKNGFPVFATLIEANYIHKKEDLFSAYKLTDEDKAEVLKLSKDPRIGQRIIKSIAPSIFGHEHIKTGLALAMLGGQEKNVDGKHRLRGDINMLLLGDPGTAKSQFLKYVEKTAQRAVYTTGKGASAVGLTAGVHKDPITREWTLEGGALVLADRGMCLIDEFDKMNDHDRVSIHEAMEQQSISVSKAGIVTSLQARCSVIAAANPTGGRYDSSKTFAENVELTDPILSRFDILCVVKDVVDPVTDAMLAKFVVNSHRKSHPSFDPAEDASLLPEAQVDDEVLPQELLRKYITYAKQNVAPKLHDADLNKLAQVYADLRRESMSGQGVPIAVRHIESMIRMAEAHARMHLRSYVREEDVDMAIRVMLESFVSTQKFGVQKQMAKTFNKFLTFKKDYNELLLYVLRQLVREAARLAAMLGAGPPDGRTEVPLHDLQAKAAEYDINDLQPFFSSTQFSANNFTLDSERSLIIHERLQ
ncbi:DNA replication licensing factor MCM2 component [Klebsormidium nitens]|uniref:DNA replication licensing factor MCM2 n=1 Tax=Klebsormidium nitens TaxID=105231 RepID=A0A1Y1IEH0_KLENI|nr:DNA replication licensing factor MCM2 component [Klebsormidium nitens]|eukprot:GAQ88362.1 DNA replication licensing factor MCM2 component [Klebsormidium nitens]